MRVIERVECEEGTRMVRSVGKDGAYHFMMFSIVCSFILISVNEKLKFDKHCKAHIIFYHH